MGRRTVRDQGFYCSTCGMVQPLGEGFITCRNSSCSGIGLRGYDRRPRRVWCEVVGCRFSGWDDGGVNDDIGRHMRRDHADAAASVPKEADQ